MHLCIFLLEATFNQFSPQKVSFEVSFRNIIRAAWFCRRCNSLQHPSEISPRMMMMMMVMIMMMMMIIIIIIISLDFPRVDIFHLLFP